MRTVCRRQRGLSFVECLVSIVILGVGLLGISAALTAALVSNQKASDIELATAVAQDTIEEMRSLGFGDVTYDNFPQSAAVAGLHGGTRTVAIQDAYGGDPRLRKVTVTVFWQGRNGRPARMRAETIIGNRAGHPSGGHG